MMDAGGGTRDSDERPINWPAIADPMVLLDELERRLEHCETTVSAHLDQIQRRLDVLERDMSNLKSEISNSRLVNERQVVQLADRLTELENRSR